MKLFLLTISLFIWITVFSQAPAGYYNNANNLAGNELQQALHQIINNHTAISYSAIWNAFNTTDKKPNGKVWDIYSDIPGAAPAYEYTMLTNQCGNYSKEGDCYNREHSFPVSWFNDQSPMNTDLFQVYPTDGFVNQKRGNYPFGETTAPTWVSTNGSKLGQSSVSGYTGTVFEPIDEYKGDLARTYFYMATRYYGQDANWTGSPMVDGAQPKPWAMAMLLQWHLNDPVSSKETNRNNAAYNIQGNRNPFIDHPEYAAIIWSGALPDEEEEPAATVPSNHVNGFSPWFITLSWTDATGENLPTGYLVLISDQGFPQITAPQNGTPPDYYSNSTAVDYGVGQCTFTNLEKNTNYYFKIYPYSGKGTNTIYLLDGQIPQLIQKTD